ncbi:MAG TPA: 2-oxoglutarate dehydrogenase complex dihydrolipoyllysine-residue succinyltransferase [Bacteroidales bacterium]|nr:2-oxoglutarate dehydrogenase complex dihydrolipoyllysine-residue succinyltransferase [Bacteroidales bacterium]
MKTEVKIPSPGESITQVQLAAWLVKNGDYVERDQELAEIDSDKATLSINAPVSGKIELLHEEGETLEVGAIVARIDADAAAPVGEPAKPAPAATVVKAEADAAKEISKPAVEEASVTAELSDGPHFTPLARKLMAEKGISEADYISFLRSLRVTKEDIAAYPGKGVVTQQPLPPKEGSRDTERRKMSTLRMKLSERLVSVKNETAMLTTFNEVDMSAIMEIRRKYKDAFQKQHGIGLGFMSFFTKAVTIALAEFPQVNAILDEDALIFHDYVDIGIAVSSPKGLMVPVLRSAESLSLAEIEQGIKVLAEKARNNKITLEEMQGGTFTITNGGVFGSLLSTPILNPPQSAILGMHTIQERPVAVDGKVEIHPMMYVALSYDHRVIDGKESVSFLVRVKTLLENPVGMLFPGSTPFETLLGL